jgi:hypothetical protein
MLELNKGIIKIFYKNKSIYFFFQLLKIILIIYINKALVKSFSEPILKV